ncbi:MAG: acyl-homoserine-lactone synthase [Paracoccaceae bacterium]
MIRFLNRNQLTQFPSLEHQMFRDRAIQFSMRLGWDVSVNSNGEERDQYDELDSIYVVSTNSNEHHLGSMRLMPTTGRTMVNEHFSHLFSMVSFHSNFVWECTRFCVSQRSSASTAPLLLAAGGRFMQELGVKQFVGVFDRRMERVYRRLGVSPIVLGRSSTPEGEIGLGLWEFQRERYEQLLLAADVSASEMDRYIDDSYKLSDPLPSEIEAAS